MSAPGRGDGAEVDHLRYIQRQADAIGRVTGALGRDGWMADHLAIAGTSYMLQTLAESTQRLSPECRDRHPDVPWKAITGMRNRLAHAYLTIDPALVWVAASTAVPPLGRLAGRELERSARRDLGGRGADSDPPSQPDLGGRGADRDPPSQPDLGGRGADRDPPPRRDTERRDEGTGPPERRPPEVGLG